MIEKPPIAYAEARDTCAEMAFLLRKAGPHAFGTTVDKYTSLVTRMEATTLLLRKVVEHRAARSAGSGGA